MVVISSVSRAVVRAGPPGPGPGPKRNNIRGDVLGLLFLILNQKNRISYDKKPPLL
jgi:hypothetical protein